MEEVTGAEVGWSVTEAGRRGEEVWKVQGTGGEGLGPLGRERIPEAPMGCTALLEKIPPGLSLAQPCLGPPGPYFHQSCWQRGQSPGKTDKPECHQPTTKASGGGWACVREVKARSKPASRPRPVIPERAPRGMGARCASELCWQPVVLHHYL